MRTALRCILTGACLAVSACGSEPAPATGIVTGTVTQSPTCPVEQPGQDCAPRPVAGTVSLRRDGEVVETATLAADGTYTFTVPEGWYTIAIDIGDNPLPSCPDLAGEVHKNETTTVDIDCDTGIR